MPRRRFAHLSLSAKLTSSLALANLVGVIIASFAFVLSDRATYRATIERRLVTEAALVSASAAAPFRAGDFRAARAALGGLAADTQLRGGGLYDRRGRRLASHGALEAPPAIVGPAGTTETLHVEFSRVALVRAIGGEPEPLGWVYLEAELTELHERTLTICALAIAVVFAAPIVGFVLSRPLQKRIVRPILDLAGIARLVSTGENYSVRASPGGSDETGFLVLAFNQMLARIQQRDSSLKAEIAEREKTQAELVRARDAAVATRRREEEARRAAEQASSLKSAFLANMSHEIRTPLNVILGYNSLIQADLEEKGDETQLPLIEGIARASKRLMTTVHGILDMSRIESGAFDIHPAPIRVVPFVARLVEDYGVLARTKDLELALRAEDDGTTIVFDEYCLSHSLTNLLDNAIKFTDRGGITVSVGRDRDGGVAIEVRDTGIGIDPAYLPKIAEPFSQAEHGSTRKFDGAGLGLALTKRFLETHDATLTVTSRQGEGASFVIHVPAEWLIVGSDAPPGADPGDFAKPCVLVVEDDADSREVMRVMLADRYRVLTAANAADARRKLAFPGRSVRLVLMDIALPGDEDGLELTRSLRADERWRTLPIVAVTAHAFAEDRENALRSGCDAYLAKPVDRARLLSVVQGFTG